MRRVRQPASSSQRRAMRVISIAPFAFSDGTCPHCRHGITSACDGAVWRIDVGLARHYNGPIQVLELVDGKPPAILTGTR